MGLDMYLKRKVYVGAEYEHNNVDGVIFITREGKKLDINFNKVSYIEETAGYWRKANHIHNWFVENAQNGMDDCNEYYVSDDNIKDLKKLCETVLLNKDKAEELLPCTSGFFFGDQDYDEWYFDSLKETITILSAIEGKSGEFYYHSSW